VTCILFHFKFGPEKGLFQIVAHIKILIIGTTSLVSDDVIWFNENPIVGLLVVGGGELAFGEGRYLTSKHFGY
jgi:hypothetical protein